MQLKKVLCFCQKKRRTNNEYSRQNKIFEKTDKSSVLGKTANQAIEGIGQSAVFGVAGQANKALGNTIMFSQGFGSGLEEAYSQENVEDWQALLKATGSGTVSLVAENVFDLVGEGSKISKTMKENFLKSFDDGIARGIAKTGLSAVGEGSEEILESVLNVVANKTINAITDLVGHGAKFDENLNITLNSEDSDNLYLDVVLGEIPQNTEIIVTSSYFNYNYSAYKDI